MQGIRPVLRLVAGLSLAALLGIPVLAGAADAPGEAPEAIAQGPSLLSIGVASDAAGTAVTLTGDAPLAYEYFLIEGASLVLDVDAAAGPGVPAEQPLDDPRLKAVRVAARTAPRPGSRVVLDLRGSPTFSVTADGPRIVVALAGGAPAGEADAAATPAAPSATRLAGVRGAPRGDVFEILLRGEGALDFRIDENPGARRISLLLPGAALSGAVPPATDFTAYGANVRSVAVEALPGPGGGVRATVELREIAPYRVARSGNDVLIRVTEPAPAPAAAAPAAAAPPEPAPARSYGGARISLDFVDADILDIFRLIAGVSGMNIVAADDVRGKRSVHMTDIPWDQALDLILVTNTPKLAQFRESGNVIRISTLQRVLDERAEAEKKRLESLQIEAAEQKRSLERIEAERKLETELAAQAEARELRERQRSKGWIEKTFLVSYGVADEVGARLKTYFSGCTDGCVFVVGKESNTIFVRDFADNMRQMEAVFESLESPTPTVLVEARIVEVMSDFSRSIGVQWGAQYTADAAHGNATRFAFPNSVGIGGAAEQGSEGINPGTYLVNLPATAPVAGVGLSLGHIANTFSLDAKLSALEKMGKTKILSNPKILVTQNREAEINIGSQLPVPITDAEGNRTIEWKKVGITLKVTPRVTRDAKVFMDVEIKKDSRGETVRTTEGEMFSIEDRSATTMVLVGDGETSVIGGIYVENTFDNQTGVPWFERLPVLGWLFKSRSSTTERTELMIFLTPRITSPSATGLAR